MTESDEAVWWVNQGSSFRRASQGGYLWAPKQNKHGQTFVHWTNMRALKVGDVVVHYADGAVRALSRVERAAYDSDWPVEEEDSVWENDGMRADVSCQVLSHPVSLSTLPLEARPAGLGPFTVTGGVKQGYLWDLPKSAATALRGFFSEDWPPPLGAAPRSDAPQPKPPLPARHSIYDSLEAEGFRFPDWLVTDYLLSLAAKPFVLLSGISGTGKTKLAQMVAEFIAPSSVESEIVGGPPEPDQDSFVHRVGLSTLRYGVTIPRQAAGLFPDLEPGQGVDCRVLGDDFSGSGRFYNVGHTTSSRETLTVRWHKDTKAWVNAHVREGDYLVMTVESPGKLAVKLQVEEPKREMVLKPSSRVAFMSVRADWTDNRAMLGYYNPLTERYMPTPLLQLLLHATAHPYETHFAILDEMNLAKVEYYFSDFLSAMESGTDMLLHSAGDGVLAEIGGEDVQIPQTLKIPPNVVFTGTVNIDETTYMFSPKVLDRANVIEFHDVDLGAYSAVKAPGQDGSFVIPASIDLEAVLKSRPARRDDYLELPADARVRLVAIHTILADYHLHFGYRVANEIGRYVRLARELIGPRAVEQALDIQVLQKVLPKLAGNRARLERPLWKLVYALHGQTGEAPRLTQTELLVARQQPTEMPRTAAKLERMLNTVREVGFVSYVE
jgi:energy-coupling factor transporter ATP-binding protein EcfA2